MTLYLVTFIGGFLTGALWMASRYEKKMPKLIERHREAGQKEAYRKIARNVVGSHGDGITEYLTIRLRRIHVGEEDRGDHR